MTRAQLLQRYLDDVRAKRFRPGTHDCALFVAGWVKIATGTDHARGWRGKYRSLTKGQSIMQAQGFDDHIAFAASLLPETPASMAHVGDLAVIDGKALGIVASDRVFVLHPDGLTHVSRMRAEKAFTV